MKDKLILFVHGLGSNSQKTWAGFPELVRDDEEIKKLYDINFFDYEQSTARIKFPLEGKYPKIQDIARGLKSEIKFNYSAYESIILVCHSMGGLIGRKYILEEIKDKSELKVKKMLLYAVPNHGAELAKLAEGMPLITEQVKQLSPDSDFIEFLNKDWQTYEVEKKIKIVYVAGGKDKIVNLNDSQICWCNSEFEIAINNDHSDIVQPRKREELSYRILKNFVLNTAIINALTQKKKVQKLEDDENIKLIKKMKEIGEKDKFALEKLPIMILTSSRNELCQVGNNSIVPGEIHGKNIEDWKPYHGEDNIYCLLESFAKKTGIDIFYMTVEDYFKKRLVTEHELLLIQRFVVAIVDGFSLSNHQISSFTNKFFNHPRIGGCLIPICNTYSREVRDLIYEVGRTYLRSLYDCLDNEWDNNDFFYIEIDLPNKTHFFRKLFSIARNRLNMGLIEEDKLGFSKESIAHENLSMAGN